MRLHLLIQLDKGDRPAIDGCGNVGGSRTLAAADDQGSCCQERKGAKVSGHGLPLHSSGVPYILHRGLSLICYDQKSMSHALSALILMSSISNVGQGAVLPPVAKVSPKETTIHGVKLVDPYGWLREKTKPDVIQYLEAENRYTESVMQDTAKLRDEMYKEILGRIKETDLSVPTRQADFFYYTRTEKGKQYAIHCRKKAAPDAVEEVLLDENELAKSQKYFRVGRFAPSPDHKLLAYSVDTEGDEIYTLRVKDLATGKLLSDEVPNTYYSVEWAEDNRTLFYNVLDEAKRPYKLFRHTLGTKATEDVLVYHEKDQLFTLEFGKTRSRQYLLIQLESPMTSRNSLSARGSADGRIQNCRTAP